MNKESGRKSQMKKEGTKQCSRLSNELETATEKTKKEYIDSIRNKIMRCQSTRCLDLVYMKTKVLGSKENRGIQNTGIEDYQKNIIVHQRQVLKIWEYYVTELYGRPDRPDRPQNLEVGCEKDIDAEEKELLYFAR
jgi:hypothetical protein